MTERWTPGPYSAVKWANSYGWNVIHPAGDAELGNWMMAERIRREEEAHLFAAAPELYDALSKLAHEVAAICAIAETAIREAAGNTNYSVLWERQANATLALAKARGES